MMPVNYAQSPCQRDAIVSRLNAAGLLCDSAYILLLGHPVWIIAGSTDKQLATQAVIEKRKQLIKYELVLSHLHTGKWEGFADLSLTELKEIEDEVNAAIDCDH